MLRDKLLDLLLFILLKLLWKPIFVDYPMTKREIYAFAKVLSDLNKVLGRYLEISALL